MKFSRLVDFVCGPKQDVRITRVEVGAYEEKEYIVSNGGGHWIGLVALPQPTYGKDVIITADVGGVTYTRTFEALEDTDHCGDNFPIGYLPALRGSTGKTYRVRTRGGIPGYFPDCVHAIEASRRGKQNQPANKRDAG